MKTTISQYVEICQNRAGQDRPYIKGSRVRVQDIVLEHERFGQSAEEILRGYPQLTLAQIHGALAYFHEDRGAVWLCVREDEAAVEELRKQTEGQATA